MKQFSDLQIEYNATDKKYKMALEEFNSLKKKVRVNLLSIQTKAPQTKQSLQKLTDHGTCYVLYSECIKLG